MMEVESKVVETATSNNNVTGQELETLNSIQINLNFKTK